MKNQLTVKIRTIDCVCELLLAVVNVSQYAVVAVGIINFAPPTVKISLSTSVAAAVVVVEATAAALNAAALDDKVITTTTFSTTDSCYC